MTKSFSVQRSSFVVACLLFSAVLLASVSNATARTFTYNIVDYPGYETDQTTGGTDTISGTIVTDVNNGPLTYSDIVGGHITVQNPTYGAISCSLVDDSLNYYGVGINGTLLATPEAITQPFPEPGQYNQLLIQAVTLLDDLGDGYGYDTILNYDQGNDPASDNIGESFLGSARIDTPTSYYGYQFNAVAPPSGIILGSTDAWVIATAAPVPEPATLTLLGTALLGLGGVYLRRRRAKA